MERCLEAVPTARAKPEACALAVVAGASDDGNRERGNEISSAQSPPGPLFQLLAGKVGMEDQLGCRVPMWAVLGLEKFPQRFCHDAEGRKVPSRVDLSKLEVLEISCKKLRTSEEERDEPAGGNMQSNRVRRGKENHPALGGLIDPARAVGRSQSFKGQAQASERQAHRARKSPQSQMWKEVVALVGREAKLRKLAYLVKP